MTDETIISPDAKSTLTTIVQPINVQIDVPPPDLGQLLTTLQGLAGIQAQIDALRTLITQIVTTWPSPTGPAEPDILMEVGPSAKISAMPNNTVDDTTIFATVYAGVNSQGSAPDVATYVSNRMPFVSLETGSSPLTISGMAGVSSIGSSDIFPIVQGGANFNASFANLLNYLDTNYPCIQVETGGTTPISAMTAASTLTGAELVPLVQGGVNVQDTLSDIATFIGGGSGASVLMETGSSTKISAMTLAGGGLNGTELFPIVQGGVNKSAKTVEIVTLVQGYSPAIMPETGPTIKISAMTGAGALTGAEIFPCLQSAANVTTTLNSIAAFVGSSTFPAVQGKLLAQTATNGVSLSPPQPTPGSIIFGVTIDIWQWTVPGVITVSIQYPTAHGGSATPTLPGGTLSAVTVGSVMFPVTTINSYSGVLINVIVVGGSGLKYDLSAWASAY